MLKITKTIHSSCLGIAAALAVIAGLFLTSCASAPAPAPIAAAPEASLRGGLRFGDNAISDDAIDGLSSPQLSRATTPKHRSPAPSSRPGLATQAGREQWSPIELRSFYRKATGHPDAVDSFHYNDAAGAQAMADTLGGSVKRSGSFDAVGGRLRVSVTSRGDELPRLEASGRRIIIGEKGRTYALNLENRTKRAVEIVASVDGLDVRDGKTAAVTKNGYVIPAKQTVRIDGFRVSDQKVKQFVFGGVGDSLAAQKGAARNVGVIGLAVYDEDEAKANAVRLAEAQRRENATAFPQAAR